MRYSLTPPLVLEAAYLAASPLVDLPVKSPSFVCLVIGACCSVLALTCFSPDFYGVVSPATCVERLILRCTMGLRLAPGLLIFDSAHTSIVS
jgi:hypothetical protein